MITTDSPLLKAHLRNDLHDKERDRQANHGFPEKTESRTRGRSPFVLFQEVRADRLINRHREFSRTNRVQFFVSYLPPKIDLASGSETCRMHADICMHSIGGFWDGPQKIDARVRCDCNRGQHGFGVRATAGHRDDEGQFRFRFVGPKVGNRIAAVAGVPGDASTYYAGAASGGVWKSTDGGNRWAPIFDKQPVAAIGALAVAPSDPSTCGRERARHG